MSKAGRYAKKVKSQLPLRRTPAPSRRARCSARRRRRRRCWRWRTGALWTTGGPRGAGTWPSSPAPAARWTGTPGIRRGPHAPGYASWSCRAMSHRHVWFICMGCACVERVLATRSVPQHALNAGQCVHPIVQVPIIDARRIMISTHAERNELRCWHQRGHAAGT